MLKILLYNTFFFIFFLNRKLEIDGHKAPKLLASCSLRSCANFFAVWKMFEHFECFARALGCERTLYSRLIRDVSDWSSPAGQSGSARGQLGNDHR